MLPRKMSSQEEYMDFVEKSVFLIDSELKKTEELMSRGEHGLIAVFLPQLISIVNYAGYLRGQDGLFLDFRPSTTSQNDLYKMENEFEKRLVFLIDYIKNTESNIIAEARIKEYYLKNRGFDYK
jgi:hypothetical protein